MKNNNILCDTLQILTEKLASFQTLIEGAYHSLADCKCLEELPLENMKSDIPDILKHINAFKEVNSLTFAEQEYINFCLLLIYGNEMADFLLKLKKCPEKSLVQARSWKEIAKNFIPFLKKNLYRSNTLVNS